MYKVDFEYLENLADMSDINVNVKALTRLLVLINIADKDFRSIARKSTEDNPEYVATFNYLTGLISAAMTIVKQGLSDKYTISRKNGDGDYVLMRYND